MFENYQAGSDQAAVNSPAPIADLYRDVMDALRSMANAADKPNQAVEGLPNVTWIDSLKPESGSTSGTVSGALPDTNGKCIGDDKCMEFSPDKRDKLDKLERPGGLKERPEPNIILNPDKLDKPELGWPDKLDKPNKVDKPDKLDKPNRPNLLDKPDVDHSLDNGVHIKPDQKIQGRGPVNDMKPNRPLPEDARHVSPDEKVSGPLAPIQLPDRADRLHRRSK